MAEIATVGGNDITVSSALSQVLVVDLGSSRFLRQVQNATKCGCVSVDLKRPVQK